MGADLHRLYTSKGWLALFLPANCRSYQLLLGDGRKNQSMCSGGNTGFERGWPTRHRRELADFLALAMMKRGMRSQVFEGCLRKGTCAAQSRLLLAVSSRKLKSYPAASQSFRASFNQVLISTSEQSLRAQMARYWSIKREP